MPDLGDLNFISLTPLTGLDLSRNRYGRAEERVIIYKILSKLSILQENSLHKGLYKALQVGKCRDRWDSMFEWEKFKKLDTKISDKFQDTILDAKHTILRKKMLKCCFFFKDLELKQIKKGDRNFILRREVVCGLRETLAKDSLKALEPKLVILDEFQRFKNLLKKSSDTLGFANLAEEFFNIEGLRILLLSATPYKMFTGEWEKRKSL